MTYRELALRKAITQLGVKESPAGSNRGPMVDKYQEADSLTSPDHGYAWCASFVNWCFKVVGRPLTELGRSASVGSLLSNARKRGWVHNTPMRGDLICFDWNTLDGPGHGDWPDHIGFVERVSGSTLTTIEGNTSLGNDSNGGQVMRRTRDISMAEAFIRVPGKPLVRYEIRTKNGDVLLKTSAFAPGLVGEKARVARLIARNIGTYIAATRKGLAPRAVRVKVS